MYEALSSDFRSDTSVYRIGGYRFEAYRSYSTRYFTLLESGQTRITSVSGFLCFAIKTHLDTAKLDVILYLALAGLRAEKYTCQSDSHSNIIHHESTYSYILSPSYERSGKIRPPCLLEVRRCYFFAR